MNKFVYHKIPKTMMGNTLYPLNALKEIFPKVYESEQEKYKDRLNLLKKEILPLGCLWNDVIHLSPIEPTIIKSAMVSAGIITMPKLFYYKIPLSSLDARNLTLYFPSKGAQQNEKFFPYSSEDAYEFTIPDETFSYYLECGKNNTKPLMHFGLPHVFYKGEIDIMGIEIISV